MDFGELPVKSNNRMPVEVASRMALLQARLGDVRAANTNRFNQFSARTAVNETVLGGQSPSDRLRLALQNVRATVSGTNTSPTYVASAPKQKDNTIA